MITEGGNKGRLILIDNLIDNSFFDAVNLNEPRLIKFLKSGWIEFANWLKITNPHLTIEGEGKIGFRNHPDNAKKTVRNETNDVIIRGIAIRSGPSAIKTVSGDCISIFRSKRFWLDQCSLSWATDELLDIEGSEYIEISRCVLSEALHNSSHKDGPHSMGFRVGNSKYISYHHNLTAHCYGRGLGRIKKSTNVDIAYNTCYNPGGSPSTIADSQVNYRFNRYVRGANSKRDYIVTGDGQVYQEENSQPGSTVRADSTIDIVPNPFPHIPIDESYMTITNMGIGDVVDRRIVNDVRISTGQIIDHPDEVGGWPEFDDIPTRQRKVFIPVNISFENSEVIATELVEDNGQYKAVFTIE